MSALRLPSRPRPAGDISRGQVAWAAFRAFRRTRPFWGGLLMMFAGAEIAYLSASPIGLVLSGGWDASAGYLLGGALIVFGVVVWSAPMYAPLLGLAAVFVALLAFVASNLGGFLFGTVLGIVAGAMTFGWGDKPVRLPSRGSRRG